MDIFALYKTEDDININLNILKKQYHIDIEALPDTLDTIDSLFLNCYLLAAGYSFSYYIDRKNLLSTFTEIAIITKDGLDTLNPSQYYFRIFYKLLKNHCIITTFYSFSALSLSSDYINISDCVFRLMNNGFYASSDTGILQKVKSNYVINKRNCLSAPISTESRNQFNNSYDALHQNADYMKRIFNYKVRTEISQRNKSGKKPKDGKTYPDTNTIRLLNLFDTPFSYLLLKNRCKSKKGALTYDLENGLQKILKCQNILNYDRNTFFTEKWLNLRKKYAKDVSLQVNNFINGLQIINSQFLTDIQPQKADYLLLKYKQERSFHNNLFGFCYSDPAKKHITLNGKIYSYSFEYNDKFLPAFAKLPNTYSKFFVIDFISRINTSIQQEDALNYLLGVTFPIFEYLFSAAFYQCCNSSLEEALPKLKDYVETHFDCLTNNFLNIDETVDNLLFTPYLSKNEKEKLAKQILQIFDVDFLSPITLNKSFEIPNDFKGKDFSKEQQYYAANSYTQNLPFPLI